MATNYPTTLDTLTNPTATDTLDSPSHAGQHANSNDAIEALQAKVGADSSAVTTSHDYKLSGVTGSDKAVSLTGTDTLTNKTLASPVLNTGVSGTAVLDDDTMATATATTIASSESIKAYVDSNPLSSITASSNDTLTNKTIDANGTGNNISNLETDDFAANVIDTDENLSANSDTRIPSQQAVKGYVDANTGATQSKDYSTRISIDGSTTPKAVFLNDDDSLNISNASATATAKFIGFLRENVTSNTEDTNTTSTSTTFSHTMAAGDNRLILVASAYDNGSTNEPTGVTYNGNALTKVAHDYNAVAPTMGMSLWYRYEGSSASPTTANVVVTYSSANTAQKSEAITFFNVDQTNGIQANVITKPTTDTITITPNKMGSVIQYFFATNSSTVMTITGATQRTNGKYSGDKQYLSAYETSYATTNASATITPNNPDESIFIALEVWGAPVTGATVEYAGLIDTFSGLTRNSIYYVTDTLGGIGTSAGTTTVKCGKAISDTDLLIVHD